MGFPLLPVCCCSPGSDLKFLVDRQHPLLAEKGTLVHPNLWAPRTGGLAHQKAASAQTPSFLALALL